MKGVILAQAQNERLHSSKPTAMVELLGIPLVERTLKSAVQSGLKEFVIVSGADSQSVIEHVDGLDLADDIQLTHVVDDQWSQGSAHALGEANAHIDGPFIVLDVAHLFDNEQLERLINADVSTDEACLLIDTQTAQKSVDLQSVYRVHVENNRIRAFTRGLAEYDAYATGVYRLPASIFDHLDEDQDFEKALNQLVSSDLVSAIDIDGGFWSDLNSEQSLDDLETQLLDKFKNNCVDSSIKRHIFRPFTTRLSRLALSFALGGRQLILISLILSLLAAWMLCAHNYAGAFFGAIFAFLASAGHICAEEVGRLKHEINAHFIKLSKMVTQYSELFLIAGLTTHAVANQNHTVSLITGLLAASGIIMMHYFRDDHEKLNQDTYGKLQIFLRSEVRFLIIALGALLNSALPALAIIAVWSHVLVVWQLFEKK